MAAVAHHRRDSRLVDGSLAVLDWPSPEKLANTPLDWASFPGRGCHGGDRSDRPVSHDDLWLGLCSWPGRPSVRLDRYDWHGLLLHTKGTGGIPQGVDDPRLRSYLCFCNLPRIERLRSNFAPTTGERPQHHYHLGLLGRALGHNRDDLPTKAVEICNQRARIVEVPSGEGWCRKRHARQGTDKLKLTAKLRVFPMLLQGIFPPITTPFYPDGNVYFKKLEHNVEQYSKTPVAGLTVLGSTGEAIMLSDEERRQVLKAAREASAPSKVLIAGTGIESAIETLRLTEYAAELGYDVALVRTPHFYKRVMQSTNMLAFYRTVADRSPLPVMIYNVPGFTGFDIPAEVVVELAGHSNIIGMKESGGDVEKIRKMVEGTRQVKRAVTVTETFDAVTLRMLKASSGSNGQGGELVQVAGLGGSKPSSAAVNVVSGMKTRQKEVGFQIVVGLAQKLEPSLEAGAVGGILAFADAAPTACYEIYAAWKEGDAELARLKQERIAKATLRVSGELGISGLKYGMDLNGYYGGPSRLPLLPLTADLKAEVEQLLGDIRN